MDGPFFSGGSFCSGGGEASEVVGVCTALGSGFPLLPRDWAVAGSGGAALLQASALL